MSTEMVTTAVDNSVMATLESRVQEMVDARSLAIAQQAVDTYSQFVDRRIQEMLQQQMEAVLGESSP